MLAEAPRGLEPDAADGHGVFPRELDPVLAAVEVGVSVIWVVHPRQIDRRIGR